jgi:hypothetical protein
MKNKPNIYEKTQYVFLCGDANGFSILHGGVDYTAVSSGAVCYFGVVSSRTIFNRSLSTGTFVHKSISSGPILDGSVSSRAISRLESEIWSSIKEPVMALFLFARWYFRLAFKQPVTRYGKPIETAITILETGH